MNDITKSVILFFCMILGGLLMIPAFCMLQRVERIIPILGLIIIIITVFVAGIEAEKWERRHEP